MQFILVTYDNRKRHGAYPLVRETCEGCISSNGQVVLFSEKLTRKGFNSVSEIEEILGEYGNVVVDYIAPQSTMPQLSMLTRIVLRDLIKHNLSNNEIHNLIWYYAAKYEDADAEQELKDLKKWLESET